MLKRIRIAPNGPVLSRLVYGTWRLLDQAPAPQAINRLLHRCVEVGITTLDTAEIYGLYQVETALGRALALSPGLRDQLEIVTKAGIYVPNPQHPQCRASHYDARGARLVDSVDRALQRLKTDRLELFLVHRPDWLTSIDDTAQGLNQLLQSGRIRSVGVSNHSASQFDALNSRLDQPLVTNQVEFSLLHMQPMQDGTFDQCQIRRIHPMAWSPLAGGRLFNAGSDAVSRLERECARLSGKYADATLDQLGLAWVLAHPSGPLPVIGTGRVARIESAVRAAGITLEREDWYALWAAATGQALP